MNGHKLGGLIDFAVDDQVERQGKLMPGSQLEIKSPEALQAPGTKSLVILAVNQENETRVSAKILASCTESKVALLIVMGPTDIGQELDAFIAGRSNP